MMITVRSRRAHVEQQLPVRRSKGALCPDQRRLRDLTGPFEQPFVLWDLVQGFAERTRIMRGKGVPAFSRIKYDVFSQSAHLQPNFPVLLSSHNAVSLNNDAFITEMQLILDMESDNRFEGTHIYSLRVVKPLGYVAESMPEDIPYATRVELRSGFLSHDLLYSTLPERRVALLEAFLHNAETLEISLRALGRDMSRKIVHVMGRNRLTLAGR